MSKLVKNLVERTYTRRFVDLSEACVVDVTRLDVQSVTRLRAGLRTKGINVTVVKNSLARRALKGTALEPIGEALSGPCALVTGGDSVIDTARELVEAAREFEKLELKQAMIEGDPALLAVEDLARMKSHTELLADLSGLVMGPGSNLAGCLRSAGSKIAGCLKARIDEAA